MTKRMVLLVIALALFGLLTFHAGVLFGLNEEPAHVLMYLVSALFFPLCIIEVAKSCKILAIDEKQLKMQSYIVLSKLPDGKILLHDLRAGEYFLGDFETYPPKGYRETQKGEHLILLPDEWRTWPTLPELILGQW